MDLFISNITDFTVWYFRKICNEKAFTACLKSHQSLFFPILYNGSVYFGVTDYWKILIVWRLATLLSISDIWALHKDTCQAHSLSIQLFHLKYTLLGCQDERMVADIYSLIEVSHLRVTLKAQVMKDFVLQLENIIHVIYLCLRMPRRRSCACGSRRRRSSGPRRRRSGASARNGRRRRARRRWSIWLQVRG